MSSKAFRGAAGAAMAVVMAVAVAAEPDVTGPPSLAASDARLCFYRETWHALSVQPDVTVNGAGRRKGVSQRVVLRRSQTRHL